MYLQHRLPASAGGSGNIADEWASSVWRQRAILRLRHLIGCSTDTRNEWSFPAPLQWKKWRIPGLALAGSGHRAGDHERCGSSCILLRAGGRSGQARGGRAEIPGEDSAWAVLARFGYQCLVHLTS